MFVHQTWKESRLKLPNDIFEEGDDYVTLPPEFFENLWQPELQIQNSKIAGKAKRRFYIIAQCFCPSLHFTHLFDGHKTIIYNNLFHFGIFI